MKTQIKYLDRSKLNARFHQLVGQRHLDKDEKQFIVHQASNGECTSTSELNNDQLADAIRLLEIDVETSIKKMRAKAINKAKELGIIPDQIKKNEDWKGLNTFCQHTFKKPFYALQYDDLRNCITGLEKWQSGRQDKALKELLS
jgi:hypothetical protein